MRRTADEKSNQGPANDGISHDPIHKFIKRDNSTLLERFGIEHIDLLMIETEGFDCEIIKKMFDIAETRPGMIIFEHVHLPERAYDGCLVLLRRNDYVVHRFGPNTAATLDVAALSSRGSRTHRNAD